EREDARERARFAQAREERDRAALREAREHDALGRHATRAFARDEAAHVRTARAHAGLVLRRRAAESADVAPPPHRPAAVDRDGTYRRVREHETHARRELELGHDRFEVVAVGAQAVQPDHGAGRLAADRDLDTVEFRFHRYLLPARGGAARIRK